ncbi:acetyl-CoA carboxylase biotin carboxyl carrier protein subunit [Caldinitratiruptor microaerophilus]|uniref:Acetyl-CoA carboxylase biotin carboxyl carrier protein subunit n=1 Tax=Caldinitratiruptor microaerophilus TaxID=671077 RepID=A0AA35G7F9_9FIRM|nr:acetyl-CoA carboxylase biotin carboxyl carrier protein subunit [Caldinitratiruptor microaerophilus]BDG59825.1 acetyl-CoA carboxylase biotin carboxyl carrier protein subunit [Caldinitratiruptor microaerophilus]
MVVANMAGVVRTVLVKPGDTVAAGQDVIILESMKMEVPVPAASGGVVRHVKVREGDFVDEGDILVELE